MTSSSDAIRVHHPVAEVDGDGVIDQVVVTARKPRRCDGEVDVTEVGHEIQHRRLRSEESSVARELDACWLVSGTEPCAHLAQCRAEAIQVRRHADRRPETPEPVLLMALQRVS